MKPHLILPLFIAILPSCVRPIQSAYDMRNRASEVIASNMGLPTVWNIAAPLNVGTIYQRAGSASGTPVLMTYSDLYSKLPSTNPLLQKSAAQQTWSETIERKSSVKAQLGYMGLGTDGSLANVKQITFSLEGDTHTQVAMMPSFTTLLNDPTQGHRIRRDILADSKRLAAQGLGPENSAYWIATQALTAKNLNISFSGENAMSGTLKAADVKAIEAWAQVSGLEAAQMNGDIAVKQTGGVSQSQSSGLVGFLVPLVADTSGPNKGEIRMDTNHFLKVANGLAK